MRELNRALLGNDDADEEAHQPDDPERADSDDVEALNDRIEAKALWPADDVGEADQSGSEKAEKAEHGDAGFRDPFADLRQHAEEAGFLLGTNPDWLIELARPA